MTISELITKLEAEKKMYGDVQVQLHDVVGADSDSPINYYDIASIGVYPYSKSEESAERVLYIEF